MRKIEAICLSLLVASTMLFGCETKERAELRKRDQTDFVAKTAADASNKSMPRNPGPMSAEQARALSDSEILVEPSDVLAEAECPESVLKQIEYLDPEIHLIRCGVVKVPARHSEASNTNEFHRLSFLHITAANYEKKPLLVIEQGGPGFSSMELAAGYVYHSDKILIDFDVLAVEQRGTRWTSSYAECNEYTQAKINELNMNFEEKEKQESLSVLEKCYDRLNQIVDPTTISSFEIANDIPYTAKYMGYDRFSFYGVSYGTEIGQLLLKHHAENLGKVVLDGPVVPNKNATLSFYNTMDELFSENIKTSLKKWQDRVDNSYDETLDYIKEQLIRIDSEPLRAEFVYEDKIYPAIADADTMLSFLIEVSVVHYQIEYMNLFFNTINHNNSAERVRDQLSKLFQNFSEVKDHSELMKRIINCREGSFEPRNFTLRNDFPNLSRVILDKYVEVYTNRLSNQDVRTKYCPGQLAPAPVKDLLTSPITTNIPTLVVTGEIDHVTPPENVDEVSVNFTQAQRHIFKDVGHSVFTAKTCISDSILAYLTSQDHNFTDQCQ